MILDDVNSTCAFPFRYLNRTVNRCINHNREDQLFWCSTTSDFNVDRKYRFCNEQEKEEALAVPTNIPGRNCEFPFIWEGSVYYGCAQTEEEWVINHAVPWCVIKDTNHNSFK